MCCSRSSSTPGSRRRTRTSPSRIDDVAAGHRRQADPPPSACLRRRDRRDAGGRPRALAAHQGDREAARLGHRRGAARPARAGAGRQAGLPGPAAWPRGPVPRGGRIGYELLALAVRAERRAPTRRPRCGPRPGPTGTRSGRRRARVSDERGPQPENLQLGVRERPLSRLCLAARERPGVPGGVAQRGGGWLVTPYQDARTALAEPWLPRIRRTMPESPRARGRPGIPGSDGGACVIIFVTGAE